MKTHDPVELARGELRSPSAGDPRSPWITLNGWMRSKFDLAFVYSRSLGGFVQTGRGRITGLDQDYLELRTSGSTALVVLRHANFSQEPQAFFNSTFTSSRLVAGVSISLENHDWLFFADDAAPLLSHGHVLPGA